ncbi:MAG: hypothetical protein K2X82_19150, partial [Gemmataceae bacterium]|nr:hypothetical protein [Gemmataceae bacterium]
GGPPMGFNQGGPQQGGWNGGGRNWGGSPGGGWGGPPGGGGGWNGQGGPPGQPGQPGPDGQGGGKDDGKKKDAEPDFTQIGIRYGKLPPGLPGWFTELDTDKDGQVGLDEWRADGRKTEDFAALDTDGDWLLSPRELLRADAIKADDQRLAAAAQGDASPSRFPGGGAGPPGKGGGPPGPPAKGGTRGQSGGKKDRGKS